MDTMSFRGGPLDGQREPPEPGFPAPDQCIIPAEGERHLYTRIGHGAALGSSDVTHVYRYDGVCAPST